MKDDAKKRIITIMELIDFEIQVAKEELEPDRSCHCHLAAYWQLRHAKLNLYHAVNDTGDLGDDR